MSERLRAALVFAGAGALGATVGAAILWDLMGPLAAVSAVGLAAVSAGAAALLLSGPLVRARARGNRRRAALLGGAVTLLAVGLLAVTYAAFAADSLALFVRDLWLVLEAGAVMSAGLVPLGAVTGWLYARGARAQPLAPEA